MVWWASQGAPVVKTPPAYAGDRRNVGLIPGLGRSPGEGHGNPLQCSCLENSYGQRGLEATVHRVAKSSTRLKMLSTHIGLKLSMPLRDFWEFLQYEGMVISAPGCLPVQNSYSPYIRAFHLFLPWCWTSNGTHPFSLIQKKGSPGGSVVKNLPAMPFSRFNPWVGKIPWRRAWQPTPLFLLENSMDRGVWWAVVHGSKKSSTWLSNWRTTAPKKPYKGTCFGEDFIEGLRRWKEFIMQPCKPLRIAFWSFLF